MDIAVQVCNLGDIVVVVAVVHKFRLWAVRRVDQLAHVRAGD